MGSMVIEYSTDGGESWAHGRVVPAWAVVSGALESARYQVVHAVSVAHGAGVQVVTRVLGMSDARRVKV